MVSGTASSVPATTDRDDREAPLVVACLAPTDLRPEVNPLTGEVRADPRRADLTASDGAALELALRAADAWGARVLAVGAGPASIEGVLRAAIAVGARALRVPYPGRSGDTGGGSGGPITWAGSDLAGTPQATAAALAGAISGIGRPALVICGDRSARSGTGAVPALLAHHLGAGQALGLVSLRFEGEVAIGERRLDGGWRQRLRITRPSVCSVEAAGVRLRRSSLPAVLAASEQPVPTAAAPTVEPDWAGVHVGNPRPYRPRTRPVAPPIGDARQRVLALTGALVEREPPRITPPIAPKRAAAELLEYLARHGYHPPVGRPAE